MNFNSTPSDVQSRSNDPNLTTQSDDPIQDALARGYLVVRAPLTTGKRESAWYFSRVLQAREQPSIVVIKGRKFCRIDCDCFHTHSIRLDQAGMQRVCALLPDRCQMDWGATCIFVRRLPAEQAVPFVCALQLWAFRKLTVKDLTEFEIEFYARNTRAGRRGLEMFEDPPHQTEPSPPLWIPTVAPRQEIRNACDLEA